MRLARAAGADIQCGDATNDVRIDGCAPNKNSISESVGVDYTVISELTWISANYHDYQEDGTAACRKYVEENILPLLPD
jgi:hypothetical protein